MGIFRTATLALRMGGFLPPPRGLRVRNAEGLPFPCRIFETSCGGRRGAIVVAHGFSLLGPDDPRLDRFCAALAGAGFSAWLPRMEGLANLDIDPADARTLERTAQAALGGGGEKAALAGFSLGAVMAIQAATHAELRGRVSSILSASAPYSLLSIHRAAARADLVHPYARLALLWKDRESLRLGREGERAWKRLMLEWWEKEGAFNQEEIALIKGLSDHPRADGIIASWVGRVSKLAEALDLKESPALDSIGIPLFLMHGSGDALVPPESALLIAERARKAGSPARVLIIPSRGHFAFGIGAAARLLSFLGVLLGAAKK